MAEEARRKAGSRRVRRLQCQPGAGMARRRRTMRLALQSRSGMAEKCGQMKQAGSSLVPLKRLALTAMDSIEPATMIYSSATMLTATMAGRVFLSSLKTALPDGHRVPLARPDWHAFVLRDTSRATRACAGFVCKPR